MRSGFERSKRGVVMMSLDEVEVRILRHILGEMLTLLGPEVSRDVDPLAAAVGIGTSTTAPEDEALARLFPDGYLDDPDASADFRRYTEPGLRDGKREVARTALATLADAGDGLGTDKQPLTDDEAHAWLGALNDSRLVLGQRLDVTEEWEALIESMEQDDPRLPMYFVYDRLTYLQESLVRALW